MLIPDKHFSIIRAINIDEYPTEFAVEHWAKHFQGNAPMSLHLSIIWDALGSSFTRSDLVSFYGRNNVDAETKFIAAMVWGYEAPAEGRRDGRGPWRVARMFAQLEGTANTIRAVRLETEQDIVTAYRRLNEVAWVGPNFFTKHLYFLGKAQGLNPYPLIFDDRVANGLMKIAVSNPSNLGVVKIGASRTPEAYLQYLAFAKQEADHIGCALDQIEYYLFNL